MTVFETWNYLYNKSHFPLECEYERENKKIEQE